MNEHLSLDEYQTEAAGSLQKFREKNPKEVLAIGLVGEVGSFLAIIKKCVRDEDRFAEFVREAREECGDVLWYFSTLCQLSDISLSGLAGPGTKFRELQEDQTDIPTSDELGRVNSGLLLKAASSMTAFATQCEGKTERAVLITEAKQAFKDFLEVVKASRVSLIRAANDNLVKIRSRWPSDDERVPGDLPDENAEELERLPRRLTVEFRDITLHGTTYCYQLRDKQFPLGDRLTDNAQIGDGYRFHDIFHLTYAAKLGWSPVLRDLLKLKRKSCKITDEVQDGARAKIVEEGIANWLFAKAEDHNFFEDPGSIDFATLKTIREMTRKLEIAGAPYWLWEEAIREGFKTFQELKKNGGGTVTIDLNKRSIEYAPPTAL